MITIIIIIKIIIVITIIIIIITIIIIIVIIIIIRGIFQGDPLSPLLLYDFFYAALLLIFLHKIFTQSKFTLIICIKTM